MLGRFLRSAFKLLIAAGLFLLTLEAVLALWPDLLPIRLANHAYSKYGSFPGGIYFTDRESGINFQRRDFTTETYFNGYRWTHATDRHGFRRPSPAPPGGVMLLGDSLIYGHGVEQADTLAARLARDHSTPAYNMARQGDSLYQSYVLSRLWVEVLEPSRALLFVFLNDFHDVTLYRSEAEMLARPEADWSYLSMQARLVELEAARSLHPRILLGLASVRLLRGVWNDVVPPAGRRGSVATLGGQPAFSLIATAEAAEGTGGRNEPPYLDTLLEPASFARVAAYYEAGLADLAARFSDRSIDFRVVDLVVDVDLGERGRRAQERLSSFLATACQRLELSCASTAGLFSDCGGCFLPGDGHLSPEGNERLAGWVAELWDRRADRP